MTQSELDKKYVKQKPSLKIELTLTGDLLIQTKYLLDQGYYTSKPEIIRQALRNLFSQITEQELQKRRLQLLE